jgi:acyl-homoserine lactone acylase PvdQ
MLRVVFLPPDTGGPMAGRSLPCPRPLLALLVLVGVLVGVAAPVSAAPGGGQSGRVRILRDEYGVPHVYAATLSTLFYGVG